MRRHQEPLHNVDDVHEVTEFGTSSSVDETLSLIQQSFDYLVLHVFCQDSFLVFINFCQIQELSLLFFVRLRDILVIVWTTHVVL